MQLSSVRPAILSVALAALPFLTGCAALGIDAESDAAGSAARQASGDSWVVVARGDASPSPSAGNRARTAGPSPSVAPHRTDPDCAATWPPGQVLIPVAVTPGPASVSVTWPRDAASSAYRVAAVPQDLVAGEQTSVRWQPVAAGTGCTVSATITGLASGKPYIVWLDAPGTGHLTDGSRNPYSGRSGVVHPR